MSQTPSQTQTPTQKDLEPRPKIPVAVPWAWGEGYCSDIFIELLPIERTKLKRVVLLNAMVLPRKPMVMTSAPTDLENVKALVKAALVRNGRIESYIGHESTARLLSSILGVEVPVNRNMYNPQPNDIAIVVKLKKRLEKPEDVKSVKLEDIEFYIVRYEDDRVREEPPVFVIYTLPLLG
jgi:hypothetical protein